MNKNLNKTPSRLSKSQCTLSKKNKSSGKIATKKIFTKKRIKEKKPTEKKTRSPIKKVNMSYKEYPNKSKTVIREWKKASQPLHSKNVSKSTQNREKSLQDLRVKSDKATLQNWEKSSQNMLVDNILNKLNKDKQGEGNKKEKVRKGIDSNKSLKEKQKQWFDNLKQSMKNSMKNLNDAQKKALDDLEKAILHKISSKDKEDEFLKEVVLILLTQNSLSKDLQNLGQVNVSTTKRESYL